MARPDPAPKWTYQDCHGRVNHMPGLSPLQVAVLACVRDDLVTRKEVRRYIHSYITHHAEGHDITSTIRSLLTRRLIFYRFDGSKLFRLSTYAVDVLARYPEY